MLTLDLDSSNSSSYSSDDDDGSSTVSSETFDSSKVDLALLGPYSLDGWLNHEDGHSHEDSSSCSSGSYPNERDKAPRQKKERDILTELASPSSSSSGSDSDETDPSIQQIYDINTLRDTDDEEDTLDSTSKIDEAKNRWGVLDENKQKKSLQKEGRQSSRPIGTNFGGAVASSRNHESFKGAKSTRDPKERQPLSWVPFKIRRSFRRSSDKTGKFDRPNGNDDRYNEWEGSSINDTNDPFSETLDREERDGNNESNRESSVDGSSGDFPLRQKSEVDSFAMIPNLSLPEKCKHPESTDNFFSTQGFEMSLGGSATESSKKLTLLPWKRSAKASLVPQPVYAEEQTPKNNELSKPSDQKNQNLSVASTGSHDKGDLLSKEYPKALTSVRQSFTRKKSLIPNLKNGDQSKVESSVEKRSKAKAAESNGAEIDQDVSEDDLGSPSVIQKKGTIKKQSESERRGDPGPFSFLPFKSHLQASKPPTGWHKSSVKVDNKPEETHKKLVPTDDATKSKEILLQNSSFASQEDTSKRKTKHSNRGNRIFNFKRQDDESLATTSTKEDHALFRKEKRGMSNDNDSISVQPNEIESTGQINKSKLGARSKDSYLSRPNDGTPDLGDPEVSRMNPSSNQIKMRRNRVDRRSRSLGNESESPVIEKRRFSLASFVRKDNHSVKPAVTPPPKGSSAAPAPNDSGVVDQVIPPKHSSDSESDGVGEILDGPLAAPYLLQLWDRSCSPIRVAPQENVGDREEIEPVDTKPEAKKRTISIPGCGNSFSDGLGFGADTILLGSLLPSEMEETKATSDVPTEKHSRQTSVLTQLRSEKASLHPILHQKKQHRAKAKQKNDLQHIVHKIKKLKEIQEGDLQRQGSSDSEKRSPDDDETREPISFRLQKSRQSLRDNSKSTSDHLSQQVIRGDIHNGAGTMEHREENEDWYNDLMPWKSIKSEETSSYRVVGQHENKKSMRMMARADRQPGHTLAEQVLLAKKSDHYHESHYDSKTGRLDDDLYNDLLPWRWSP